MIIYLYYKLYLWNVVRFVNVNYEVLPLIISKGDYVIVVVFLNSGLDLHFKYLSLSLSLCV